MTPAQGLTVRIGGKWHRTYGTARCPAHDDHTPSLSIRDGDQGPLLTCHAGCDSNAIVDELKRRGWWGDFWRRDERPPRPKRSPEETRRYLLDVWRSCGPMWGSIPHLYLVLRGIDQITPPPTLRAHPQMKHPASGLCFPTMMAAVWSLDRTLIGLHRTFIHPGGEGKADVESPRMFLGNVRGGAVRLAAAGPELAVGEGLETCLSYQQLTQTPTWAALSSSGLMSVILPPLPLAQTVNILVDLDPAGEKAAVAAATRFTGEGRRVRLVRPTIGRDINDVVRHAG
jgi:putative DNA primase/helicase